MFPRHWNDLTICSPWSDASSAPGRAESRSTGLHLRGHPVLSDFSSQEKKEKEKKRERDRDSGTVKITICLEKGTGVKVEDKIIGTEGVGQQ